VRRSKHIALVLIGSATLPGCFSNSPVPVHDRYASIEDCAADWGRPEACQGDQAASGGTAGAGTGGPRIYFRGPDYLSGDRAQAQYDARTQAQHAGRLQAFEGGPSSHAIEHAIPSVSRGGFGASSHFFGRLG
jgi:uncharacterized protein YgiB involved in biofilm formation